MSASLHTPSVEIPPITLLERRPPVLFASELAIREGNSKKPIYQIHKWWARRLGCVFRSILIGVMRNSNSRAKFESAFYKKQDCSGLVVLDPFVGGGTSIVEAAKCGASVIGVDIDPVACFVTRSELQPCTKEELETAFRTVKEFAEQRILSLYSSTRPDGSPCTIVYSFWVEIVSCAKCHSSYHAHPHYQLARDRKNRRQTVFCGSCGQVREISLRRLRFSCRDCSETTEIRAGNAVRGVCKCPSCGHEQPAHDRSVMRTSKPEHYLFALQVIDENSEVHFQRAERTDREMYSKACAMWAARLTQENYVPDEFIPEQHRSDPRPICFGYKRYLDLFNQRQLLSLSWIAEAIRCVKNDTARELLAAAFSDSLASNNMLCYYAFDYDKLTPLFGLHAYHKASRPVENNVWGIANRGRGSFLKCYKKVLRGKEFAADPYEFKYDRTGEPARVHTGESIQSKLTREIPAGGTISPFGVLLNCSSERLSQIADCSVDLVLSDPPYYDNLAYSELSDFYHVWLKRLNLPNYPGQDRQQTPIGESLYVSNRTKKAADEDDVSYRRGLSRVLRECHRVLRDEGMMVFTFHHRSEEAWNALGDALVEADFKITNVFPVRSEGQSRFHSSEGNLKWDAVFCCRKKANQVPRECPNFAAWAEEDASEWAKRLKTAKLAFSNADRRNLKRAFFTMHRCNAGVRSGELKQ